MMMMGLGKSRTSSQTYSRTKQAFETDPRPAGGNFKMIRVGISKRYPGVQTSQRKLYERGRFFSVGRTRRRNGPPFLQSNADVFSLEAQPWRIFSSRSKKHLMIRSGCQKPDPASSTARWRFWVRYCSWGERGLCGLFWRDELTG